MGLSERRYHLELNGTERNRSDSGRPQTMRPSVLDLDKHKLKFQDYSEIAAVICVTLN